MATSTRSTGSMREKQVVRPAAVGPNGRRNGTKAPARATVPGNGRPVLKVQTKLDAKILFQKYFHSVGPRTYAAQVKELGNGNHLLVLTEGKRDADTGEVRKTKLLIFGEDFTAFFKQLAETAAFIRANPLSEEIKEKRRRFWAKKNKETRGATAVKSSVENR